MSNVYKLRGRVAAVGDATTTKGGYTVRELLVDDEDPRYPQRIAFTFSGDRASALDRLRPGQQVEVAFDIGGREYNGRHYVTLRGWGASVLGAAPAAPAAPAPAPAERVEDLPF